MAQSYTEQEQSYTEMDLHSLLISEVKKVAKDLFGYEGDIQLQPIGAGFEGSHTVVCFPISKTARKSPEQTATLIGESLDKKIITKFQVVKGFLNLTIADSVWISSFKNGNHGNLPPNGLEIMVE